MNEKTKTYVKPGEIVRTVACYSEVNMHMRLAGKPVLASVRESVCGDQTYYGTQYHNEDGSKRTTVTLGEGGFYREETENGPVFYCYPDDGPGDADPDGLRNEVVMRLEETLGGDGVTKITYLGL